MGQSPTEQNPIVVCEACKKEHDLTSWKSLRVVGVGVKGICVNGKETATALAQDRQCTCGGTIQIQFPLAEGTTPFQADCLVVAAMAGAAP